VACTGIALPLLSHLKLRLYDNEVQCSVQSVQLLRILLNFHVVKFYNYRSQWPRGLRCGSAVAGLLRLWIRIPQGAWMSVCCECCVLSGRGLRDEPVIRLE
jgi:hypothetical protein